VNAPRPRRLGLLVGLVSAAGTAAVAAAVASLVVAPPSAAVVWGVALLFAAATLAERFPVPVEGLDAAGVSLSFVFGVAAVVLFGWAGALVAVVAAAALSRLLERRPPERVAYNASVHGLAVAAAGVAVAPVAGYGIAAAVAVCAIVQQAVNTVLVSAAVSVASRRRFVDVLLENVRATALPFSLMASAALVLVALWQRSPALSAALAGPLLAIALYQRSSRRALGAMRLALTDPLTELGNHRHFHERLRDELEEARRRQRNLTLALVDLDDFKAVNDRFGHPAGDDVLREVASRLRQTGESFRLGGDEFAVLLVAESPAATLAAGRALVERVARLRLERVGSITISAGLAAAADAIDHNELIRRADDALYAAKADGKNAARVARPEPVGLSALRRLSRPDPAVRQRAAAALAAAVDERDGLDGGHSTRVGDLAVAIATRLALDAAEADVLWVAGALHDLGKLALPAELLRKVDPLTEAERVLVERHAPMGHRMLEGLGIGPIASWVLHHHERWDGLGYPDGLAGEQIPLGARVLAVADAFDAMTSGGAYRPPLPASSALAELERCAGTQFDPEVVAALAAEVAVAQGLADALAS
jgi:diguanylate cyclase (GGDEF)-like protein